MTGSASNGRWADSLEDWKASRLIHAQLDSGRKVTLVKCTLDELIALDALPDDLRDLATLDSVGLVGEELRTLLGKRDKKSRDQAAELKKQALRLRDHVVLFAVREPKLTEADLPDLPEHDKQMIAEIAWGRLEFDAANRRIGLEPMSTFRVHAETHHPELSAEDCEACKKARLALSTAGQ